MLLCPLPTAGDYVKFGFPMAGAATHLAWGASTFKEGYSNAGELDNMVDSLMWATDYFVAAHTGHNEFVAQVKAISFFGT